MGWGIREATRASAGSMDGRSRDIGANIGKKRYWKFQLEVAFI
jgi:hypothetical protein